MRGDALETFKNLNVPTEENLGETLAVFRKNYVKTQSMITAKRKFQKLVFNPANQNLVDFLDELQKLAKDAFKLAAHAIGQASSAFKMQDWNWQSKSAILESGKLNFWE